MRYVAGAALGVIVVGWLVVVARSVATYDHTRRWE